MRDAIRLIGATSSGGAATLLAERSVFGKLVAVEWVDGTLDDAVTAVLSVTNTPSGADVTLLTLSNPDANADKWYFPRYIIHSEAGAALTGTSGGDRAQGVINGLLKLVIASGGNVKTGGCIVYYE